MLERIWSGADTGRYCIVGVKNKVIKHFWFDTIAKAEAKAARLDQSGHDVYFAPAGFDPDQVERLRKQKNPRTDRPYSGREGRAVRSLSSFWLDLDWGPTKDYTSFDEMLTAFKTWAEQSGVPAPSYIVMSGQGLHVYWLLDRGYPPEAWVPVAQHLKQTCAVQGLKIDMSRTGDSASLLRVPGTHHRKDPDNPREVKVLFDRPNPVSLEAFRNALPAVGPQRGVPAKPMETTEWDVDAPLPPGDFPTISSKCQQIGHFAFTHGRVAEPYWRAALSVVWRCEGGEELIHEYSKGDERYDAQETEDKAWGTQGPATCRHFQDVNPEGCVNCPFAGKITSPINIGFAQEEVKDTRPDGQEEAILVPDRYTVGETGVWLKATEDVPPTRIMAVPLWLTDIRIRARDESERGASHLHLRWRDLHGQADGALIDQHEIYDERALQKWLANHNLAAFVYSLKGFSMYIKNLTPEHYRRKGATVVYDTLGWYGDLFVLGKQGVTADGVQDVVTKPGTSIDQLAMRGSLDAWRRGIDLLDHPDYHAHAFVVCAALGAPLLEMANLDCAVVALVGDSGRGKTLAARAGLSAFANYKQTMEAGISTDNGLELRLGANKNVPVLVDEVTTMHPKRLGNLIYMAANGSGKTTANRDRSVREKTTWRTVTFLTSNHSIMDQAANLIEEAHRQRLLEIPVQRSIPKPVAAALHEAVTQNYGVAAGPYLQFALQHKEKIPRLFEMLQKQVEAWTEADDANRFVTWALAAALLGGILGRLSGIIGLDPVAIVKQAAMATRQTYHEIETPETRARNVLLEGLNENSKHVCYWGDKAVGDYSVDGAIARVRHPVPTNDRQLSGVKLYVQGTWLRRLWAEEHINRASLSDWLDDVAGGDKLVKMRLSPNAPGPVWSYCFDLEALGVEESDVFPDREASS